MRRQLLPIVALLAALQFLCGCNNNKGLRFIETGYSFEHVSGYNPDRYFSEDTLSLSDYRDIVSKYTKKYGPPLYTGEKDDAMRNYKIGDSTKQLHCVWGYATDGEYYTIYQQESTFLLVIFTHHCGVYVFQ